MYRFAATIFFGSVVFGIAGCTTLHRELATQSVPPAAAVGTDKLPLVIAVLADPSMTFDYPHYWKAFVEDLNPGLANTLQSAFRGNFQNVSVVEAEKSASGADLVAFQRLVRRVPVADPVMRYALHLVRTSRPKSKQAPDSVKKFVAFGASVRAAQYLVLGAKARALTQGRYHVSYDDIRSLAHPVLRHRVLMNFRAESEGITSDAVIDDLLAAVPVPRSGM